MAPHAHTQCQQTCPVILKPKLDSIRITSASRIAGRAGPFAPLLTPAPGERGFRQSSGTRPTLPSFVRDFGFEGIFLAPAIRFDLQI